MIKSRDSIKNSTIGTSQTCRICLSESTKAGNPFFSPCNCSGTMKYVHIKCLQRWLKSKLHVKDSGQSISIYWKTLECELCKTGYPNSFVINDQKYDIVEIERPNCAYLMLEILSKDKNMAKGLHIIKMENKNNIRLGRGHDSDIRITDISVSRCHALIKLEKGKFYLEDNNSKFGTLVNIKKPFCVAGVFNNISLQAGRTLISLSTKKNKTLFPVCFSHAAHEDSDEHEEAYSDDIDDRVETEHNVPNQIPQVVNENRISNIPRPSGDNFDDNLFIENLEDNPGEEIERHATVEVQNDQPN